MATPATGSSKDVPTPSEGRPTWFDENVTSLSEEACDLLTKYSGYSPDNVLKSVLEFRDVAFAKYHYPTIGQMRFLQFSLRQLPIYDRVIARLKSGASFMDCGCCFAQELRYIAHTEKIPIEQLYGFDIEPLFFDLGLELFRDKDRLGGNFVKVDVLADPSSLEGQELTKFDGKIDVVFCSSFLHCWPLDEMISVAKRLVKLTEGRQNAIICGKQMGSRKPDHYSLPTQYGRNYRHDEKTMAEFWKQVGEATGTSWQLEVEFYEGIETTENRHHSWAEPNQCMMWFYATKI